MKNQQRQQAQSLYLQSGLTKTQIAQHLNVARRTVYQWSLEGSWDNLRKSAQHMPAILAEKCYYLIGHFMDHLLSAESMDIVITKKAIDMLHKLTVTVNKLKQGSTVSEAMQTFTLLLARIQCHDPKLAELVAPYTQSFIHDRRKLSETDFLLDGFNDDGYLDTPKEDQLKQQQEEHELDQQDLAALAAEIMAFGTDPVQKVQQPHAQSAPEQPCTVAPAQKTAAPTPKPKQPLQPAKNKFASFRDRNKSLYSPRPSSSASKDIPKERTSAAVALAKAA